MMLVGGATGALGGMIVRQLLAQGRPVRILVREGSDYSSLVDAGAEPVNGDLKDPASLAAAVQGIDTVITTANSAVRGGADNPETVEIQGNQNLIDAAQRGGVRHFIFTSAMGAAADSPMPFMRGKGLAEEHLKRSGLTYTILSPNVFMEVWFGMILGMPLQAGQPITIVGQGDRKHSFVSMNDVAAFAVAAATDPAARNQQLFIGGPEPLSWNEVIQRAGQIVGRQLDVRRLTPGQSLPNLPDVVTGLMTAMDTYDSPVDMTATARTFGVELTPATTVLRGMLTSAR